MSTELIINASLPEVRIAQMEDGEIQDLLIERASGKGIVGNIYKGRVTRVLPGMQAAFVDIGLEKAAFLYVDDVFVHPEIWEEEEAPVNAQGERIATRSVSEAEAGEASPSIPVESPAEGSREGGESSPAREGGAAEYDLNEGDDEGPGDFEELDEDDPGSDHLNPDDHDPMSDDLEGDDEDEGEDDEGLDDEEEDEDDDDEPVGMDSGPERPDGTQGPSDSGSSGDAPSSGGGEGGGSSGGGGGENPAGGASMGGGGQGGEGGEGGGRGPRRRHRRGRRGGRHRREREERSRQGQGGSQGAQGSQGGQGGQGGGQPNEDLPESFSEQMADPGVPSSDRTSLEGGGNELQEARAAQPRSDAPTGRRERPEFKQQRGRDRRIKGRQSSGRERVHAQIQDLLKEGQEVIVQVAKDPIATKGARLTCHISLPGRHLVCMPTIDHVGVSRRIERDDERRKLRDIVDRARPKGLGFIVRTASGRGEAERRIKQDVDYLTNLWSEIREKANQVTAPALVYEDLNSVLRVIRDWVTEDIGKIVVDSRYHFNDIIRFVSHFMPSLKQKVELYQGDLPIFDTFGISTELARALERKVWLKSGGYLVIDQAEALVAIDVNTGRYVGKKNLEDTILKTNLEAVQEIAYQLRLRNCGGIIILDLIDMEKEENKMQVYRALEQALKRDRARPSILKISELGLVEMTRKRTRDTIVRALCDSCTYCEGKGFVKSKVTVAYEILREIEREGVDRDSQKVLVQAHADVIDVLAIEERDTLDQLERRYRKNVFLQAVGDYHPEQFEVSSDRTSERKAAEQFDRAKIRERERSRRGRGGRDRDRGRSGGGGGRDRGDREQQGRDRGGRDRDRDRDRGRDRDRDRDRGGDRDRGPDRDRGGENLEATAAPATPPEDMNEEDRLAFQRAQAAQDAALSGGRASGANGQGRDRGPQGERGDRDRGGGERGGRRGRRGRRGGRFRRGKEKGGQSAQPRGEGGGGGEGGGAGSGGSGGEGGGGDSGGGGGGDHSSTPVT